DDRGSGPERARLLERVLEWRRVASENRGALRYRRGRSFVRIDDARTTFGRRRFYLDGTEAAIYLACDAGDEPVRIAARLFDGPDAPAGPRWSAVEVRRFLDELVGEGLAIAEGGRYLALALPAEPRAAATPRSAVRPGARST
ncbi:MAG: hypothetical protein KDE27_06630, partial [Planctomycetes bacterium]|nr:hypothetical protein [Planctomycetota bacterium]